MHPAISWLMIAAVCRARASTNQNNTPRNAALTSSSARNCGPSEWTIVEPSLTPASTMPALSVLTMALPRQPLLRLRHFGVADRQRRIDRDVSPAQARNAAHDPERSGRRAWERVVDHR